MSIVVFGLPGSGKGTQGEMICKECNYSGIIAGDLLRTEKNSGSELGREISSLIDDGNLVPDDMVTGIIKQKVSQLVYLQGRTKGYLFDGYPRSIAQANSLDYMYEKYLILEPLDYAILLEAPEDVLIKRIIERGKSSGREDDQNETIVKNRMANYRRETEPLIEFYEKQGKLIRIDSNRPVEEVFADIKKHIPNPKYGK